jgi:nucleoside-diphosphate-sugar epimerase
MPRTLITGGAGFIGLHLARALADRGHEITLLDNFSRAVADRDLEEFSNRPAVCLEKRDLLSPDALDGLGEGYDYIVHLAALLGVQTVRNRPFEVLAFNHVLLERAIRLAHSQKQLARFLFASTSEVYGGTLRYFGMQIPTPENTPLTVDDLAEPRTSYMLSKIHGEALCRYSGLPISIIRVHNAYGPRMGLSHVIPELLRKAHELVPGKNLQVFSANHRRTFCFITDITEFIVRILETAACAGETLNVGTQAPEVTMQELGHMVLRAAGHEAGIDVMGDTPGSPQRRAPDMAKTSALTGYRSQTDLASGLALTYAWYKSNVFQGAGVSAV